MAVADVSTVNTHREWLTRFGQFNPIVLAARYEPWAFHAIAHLVASPFCAGADESFSHSD